MAPRTVLVAQARGGYKRVPLKGLRKEELVRGRRVLWGRRRRYWKPLLRKDIEVVRVTVGTGISLENKTGKGWVLSFTWSAVVLKGQAAEAAEEGRKWVVKRFGEVASRLTGKSGYRDQWGLEDMYNFAGFVPNGEETGASITDLGKKYRTHTVNGVESEDVD